jgi:phosphotransferase system HPr (HPr) family protein
LILGRRPTVASSEARCCERARRRAAIIADAVVNAGVPVFLSVDGGEPVGAGSALMIMTLGAGNGAQVTVASEDDAARPGRPV